jgi:hypothetical protein
MIFSIHTAKTNPVHTLVFRIFLQSSKAADNMLFLFSVWNRFFKGGEEKGFGSSNKIPN